MTNPAEHAAPQPEPHVNQADDSGEFDVRLPIMRASDVEAATHVVRMRGDYVAFFDALNAFVDTGSEASQPLCKPVEASSIGQLADLLNGLGTATVQSIDRYENASG